MIKAYTLIHCVVAAIILQDLSVRHFGDENVHMLMFYVADRTVSSRTRWYTIELRVLVLYSITCSSSRRPIT